MLYVSNDRPMDHTPLAPLDPHVANPSDGEHWAQALLGWLLAGIGVASVVLLCVACGA